MKATARPRPTDRMAVLRERMALARRLDAAIRAGKTTPTKALEVLDVARSTIHAWRRGDSYPLAKELPALRAFLDGLA